MCTPIGLPPPARRPADAETPAGSREEWLALWAGPSSPGLAADARLVPWRVVGVAVALGDLARAHVPALHCVRLADRAAYETTPVSLIISYTVEPVRR